MICLAALLTRRWQLREVFMAVVIYRSQQRSRRGQRIDISQSQEVSWCLLDLAHSFFFLGYRIWSFPLVFSPVVHGKPKVACFCIALYCFTYTLKLWRSSSKNFKLPNLLIFLLFTLHLFCIQCSSTRVSISSWIAHRGGYRIFLRRGCTSKEWRHWLVR